MNITNKIAFKYLIPQKGRINFISIITIISFIGITIGVAAVIIVMSIFKGFQDLHQQQVVSLDPHIRIIPKNAKWFSNKIDLDKLTTLLKKQDYISEVNKNSINQVVVFSNGVIQPAILMSMSDTNSAVIKSIEEKKVDGNFVFEGTDDYPRVFIGANLAYKLKVKFGDTLRIMTAEMIEKIVTSFMPQYGEKVTVTGLYHTNIESYDNMTIITNLELNRRIYLSGVSNNKSFNSIDLRLKSSDQVDEIDSYKVKVADVIGKKNAEQVKIESWFDLNADVFKVMKFERFASFTIVSLIILIASFNIFASLGMTVVEKQKDISILKVIGASDKDITSIFLKSGLIIGTLSSILGGVVGVSFCLLNIHYKILAINGTAYIIDHIPMKIMYDEVGFVILMSIFFSYIATIIPSKRASYLNIVSSIKNE